MKLISAWPSTLYHEEVLRFTPVQFPCKVKTTSLAQNSRWNKPYTKKTNNHWPCILCSWPNLNPEIRPGSCFMQLAWSEFLTFFQCLSPVSFSNFHRAMDVLICQRATVSTQTFPKIHGPGQVSHIPARAILASATVEQLSTIQVYPKGYEEVLHYLCPNNLQGLIDWTDQIVSQ
jgi:hypothetical protein